MVLTRSFKDTVQARAQRDPAFREALLREGVDALLSGDLGTGKAILRGYVNATIGFEAQSGAQGSLSRSQSITAPNSEQADRGRSGPLPG